MVGRVTIVHSLIFLLKVRGFLLFVGKDVACFLTVQSNQEETFGIRKKFRNIFMSLITSHKINNESFLQKHLNKQFQTSCEYLGDAKFRSLLSYFGVKYGVSR